MVVVGVILWWYLRLLLNVVIWLFEMLVMVLLIVNFVIVLEIVVFLGIEIEIVFVLDIVVLDGGVIDWYVVGFFVRVEVCVVLLMEVIVWVELVLGRVFVFILFLGVIIFVGGVVCIEFVEL